MCFSVKIAVFNVSFWTYHSTFLNVAVAVSTITAVTFYTEYAARPALWIGQWNTSYRPVVWGCTLSEDKTYVVSFTKSAASITDDRAVNGMNAPTRAGFAFDGWATVEGGSVAYTMEDIMSAPNGTTLYAVWSPKAE